MTFISSRTLIPNGMRPSKPRRWRTGSTSVKSNVILNGRRPRPWNPDEALAWRRRPWRFDRHHSEIIELSPAGSVHQQAPHHIDRGVHDRGRASQMSMGCGHAGSLSKRRKLGQFAGWSGSGTRTQRGHAANLRCSRLRVESSRRHLQPLACGHRRDRGDMTGHMQRGNELATRSPRLRGRLALAECRRRSSSPS